MFAFATLQTGRAGDDAPVLPSRADVAAVLAAAQARAASEQVARDVHIVLLADEKDHGPDEHDYPRWQSRWALLLGGAGASSASAANLVGPDRAEAEVARGAPGVRVETAWSWPRADQWARADVVVAFCYLRWNEERLAQARAFLERGGGLVLIHSATWTMPGPSPDVADVVGVGGFEQWRHGAVRLRITRPEHPCCAGLPPDIVLHDESYWPPTPAVDPRRVESLAVSDEVSGGADGASAPQPMFWAYERGAGRVWGCVLGHSSATFDHPYFRLLLLRGIAWAAREHPLRLDPLAVRCAAWPE
jgi:type 1 glutamine amidotransferase